MKSIFKRLSWERFTHLLIDFLPRSYLTLYSRSFYQSLTSYPGCLLHLFSGHHYSGCLLQVYSIRDAAANNVKRLAEEFGPEWAMQHIIPQVYLMTCFIISYWLPLERLQIALQFNMEYNFKIDMRELNWNPYLYLGFVLVLHVIAGNELIGYWTVFVVISSCPAHTTINRPSFEKYSINLQIFYRCLMVTFFLKKIKNYLLQFVDKPT